MRPKISFLFVAITVSFLQSCSSQKLNHAEQVIEWINEGQTDSLRANLHADFSFEYTDVPIDKFKDTTFFLGQFMENQKFLESTFKIAKLEHESGIEDGHRVDFYKIDGAYNNAYQKYLGLAPYKSMTKMEFNQGKLIFISMGGADKEQMKAFQEKLQQFETWMKKNHPDEDFAILNRKRDPLLIQRMKEYKKEY